MPLSLRLGQIQQLDIRATSLKERVGRGRRRREKQGREIYRKIETDKE